MNKKHHFKSIGEYTDTDGRLLAERAADAAATVTFDVRPCPYRDARFGLEMNVDALRQMRAHWTDAIASIHVLESDNRILFAGTTDTVTRFRRLTRVMGSLPEFLVLFAGKGPREIPALAAVLYKLSRGLSTLANRLTFERGGGPQEAVDLTAAALYDIADRGALLVGRSEVCAGPKAMIVEVLAALLGEGSDDHGLPQGPLDVVLAPAQRRAAVEYGAGLSDYLLARRFFADVFAILERPAGQPTVGERETRLHLAGLLAQPYVARPVLHPPVLGALMREARRQVSAFVAAGPAPVPRGLVHGLERAWERTRAERRLEVSRIATGLGVVPTMEIQVADIPGRGRPAL